MDNHIREEDVALLKREGMNEEDLAHSIKVAEKAIEIARRTGAQLDLDLVARGVIKGMLNRGIDPKNFPVVFRVPGAWEDEGFKILNKYGIKYFDRSHTMDEAAQYIVQMGKS